MNYVSVIAALLLLTSSADRALARCYVPTPSKMLQGARVVFVGKALSIIDPGMPTDGLSFRVINLVRPVTVRFAVERVFRGKKVREVEVMTQTGGLEWGYEFTVGQTYLVYAQGSETAEKALVIGGCGRTRLVAEAEEDVRFLNRLGKAKERNR